MFNGVYFVTSTVPTLRTINQWSQSARLGVTSGGAHTFPLNVARPMTGRAEASQSGLKIRNSQAPPL